MKVIIAGSRSVTDINLIRFAIREALDDIGEIVCGMAPGADLLGKQVAEEFGIPVKEFPADWDNLDVLGAVIRKNRFGKKYNTKAGHDRNARMADYADAAVVIFDGLTSGSMNMVEQMVARRKPVAIFHQAEKKI